MTFVGHVLTTLGSLLRGHETDLPGEPDRNYLLFFSASWKQVKWVDSARACLVCFMHSFDEFVSKVNAMPLYSTSSCHCTDVIIGFSLHLLMYI